MSTDMHDQALVAQLADAVPHKIVPAFGIHPWAAHTVALEKEGLCKRAHYAQLFGEMRDDQLAKLPDPVPLDTVLDRLAAYMTAYPHALVGEVGIDRSFRIPEPGTAGTPHRTLTAWQTPLAHQLAVLEAQIRLACEYGRSVSMHSVRAAGATTDLLQRIHTNPGFSAIRLDLHSCTLSAETIQQVQRQYANVYVSFSTAVNARQGKLHDQIRACDESRLLCESDWHAWDEAAHRTADIVRIMSEALGQDAAALGARLTRNFDMFVNASNQ